MAILKGGSLVGGDITIAGTIFTSSLSLSVSSITASPGNFFRTTTTPAPTGTATACYDGYFFATKLTGEVSSALINATVLNVSGGYVTIDGTKGILGDGLTSSGRNYIWGVSSTYPDYAISYYEGTPDYFAFSPNGTPASPAGKIDGNGNITASAALIAGTSVTVGTTLDLTSGTLTASAGNFFKTSNTPAPTGTAVVCYDGYLWATRYVAPGYSAAWGTTNGIYTGAVNAIMGTSTSATWLVSGTSGGTFRAGIQARDSNGDVYIYSGATTYTAFNSDGTFGLFTGALTASAGNFFKTSGTPAPTGTANVCYDGYFYATRLYNSVYNDIADFIQVEDDTPIEVGYVYCYDGEKHHKARRYAEKGIVGIASDTYGFGVGQKSTGAQIPIAIGGFVLAHCRAAYEPGTPLTCDKDGFVKKANLFVRLFHPERVIASFYKQEKASIWNGIDVKGRHWVKVK